MAESRRAGRRLPDVKAIATRAERAKPRRPRLSERERATAKRRQPADEKRLRAALARFVDVAALERLARERETSDLQRAEAAHRRAIAASARGAKWLAAQTVPAKVLAPADGEDQFIVDTASWVRAWPNTGPLRDSSTGPGANWGKYRLDIDGDILEAPDEARLSFYALWQNPRDVAVTSRR